MSDTVKSITVDAAVPRFEEGMKLDHLGASELDERCVGGHNDGA